MTHFANFKTFARARAFAMTLGKTYTITSTYGGSHTVAY